MNLALFKTCKKCGQVKPAFDYYKDKRYSDGLQSYCKACMRQYQKVWEHPNPNGERKRKAYHQKWYQDNIERRQAANQEYCRNRWHNDPEYRKRKNRQSATKQHKRRMIIRNGDNSLTLKQWNDLCAKYDYRCLACGEKKPLEQDHIIPLSKGGQNSIDNVQPLCKRCNASKATKTIDFRSNPAGD